MRAAKCAEQGLAAKREWRELKAMKEKEKMKPKETVIQMEKSKKKPKEKQKAKPKNTNKAEPHVVIEGFSTDGDSDCS